MAFFVGWMFFFFRLVFAGVHASSIDNTKGVLKKIEPAFVLFGSKEEVTIRFSPNPILPLLCI